MSGRGSPHLGRPPGRRRRAGRVGAVIITCPLCEGRVRWGLFARFGRAGVSHTHVDAARRSRGTRRHLAARGHGKVGQTDPTTPVLLRTQASILEAVATGAALTGTLDALAWRFGLSTADLRLCLRE